MVEARPLPTVIGPTENALRALLIKILSTTKICTYQAWVIMNAASHPEQDWRQSAADALKADLVDETLAELCAAGLVVADGAMTPVGISELAAARAVISAATSRLVEGIDDHDQATARRVLDHIRRKAEDALRE